MAERTEDNCAEYFDVRIFLFTAFNKSRSITWDSRNCPISINIPAFHK